MGRRQAVTALEAEAAIFQKQQAADLDLLAVPPLSQSESVAKAVVDAATHTEVCRAPHRLHQRNGRCRRLQVTVAVSAAHSSA
eukprot:4527247-Prymnesium_polylepis.1